MSEIYRRKPFNAAQGKEADERNLELERAANAANDPEHAPPSPEEQEENRRNAEKVLRLLQERGDIDTRDIHVTVEHGEITLNGTVESEASARLAGDYLKAGYDAPLVHNHLKVSSRAAGAVLDAETGSREKESPVDPSGLKIEKGMVVVAKDGAHIGTVKAVHDNSFQVARDLQHDLYIPYSAFLGIDHGRVALTVSASDVDRWGWDKPVLIPPAKREQ